MNKYQNKKGFTIIELMITVLIVGLLASLAFPSYKDYIIKAKRAEGRTALLQASMSLERYFNSNNIYTGATAGTVFPAYSNANNYQISLKSLSDQEYIVQAVPQGAQSSDPCGTLTLNQAGQKTVSGSLSVDICWDTN